MFFVSIFAPVLQLLLKILEGSEALFSRYGIKSITMDDVARELGISKKTLYKFVTDKNDLVEKTLDYHLQRNEKTCELLVNEQQNPIDAMLAIGDFFSQQMKDTSPSLLFDLRKFHHEAFKKLDEYRLNCIAQRLEENLKEGIEQEYYRPDTNIQIIPRLYMSMIDALLDGPYFPRDKFRFEEVVQEILIYHIHGIATQKGLDYLKQKFNK